MKKALLFFITLLAAQIFFSCSKTYEEKGSPAYIKEINYWHRKRIENLKKENGWLNLAGLYWLKRGENKFGTDKTNDVIFPEGKAPGLIGVFNLSDSIVTVKIENGVDVTCNGKNVSELKLKNDTQDNPTVLQYGSLRWFIIKRGDKYGVRLRDLDSPLLKSFDDIDTYPINSDWRIEAHLEPYNPAKKILVPNILGMVDTALVKNAIVFVKDGVTCKIDPLEEGNKYFIIFADKTSGKETYGAGRFLYADKPDSTGKLFVDFNKAYNPPCSFTKFATCPLPPKQNHLMMEVTAGEKKYGHGEE